jgi:hypothetical protein
MGENSFVLQTSYTNFDVAFIGDQDFLWLYNLVLVKYDPLQSHIFLHVGLVSEKSDRVFAYQLITFHNAQL